MKDTFSLVFPFELVFQGRRSEPSCMALVVEPLRFWMVRFGNEVGIASDPELVPRRCEPPSDLDLGVLAELLRFRSSMRCVNLDLGRRTVSLLYLMSVVERRATPTLPSLLSPIGFAEGSSSLRRSFTKPL